jgi:hypothetical protein
MPVHTATFATRGAWFLCNVAPVVCALGLHGRCVFVAVVTPGVGPPFDADVSALRLVCVAVVALSNLQYRDSQGCAC